jgi:hypothetical protein
MPRAIIAIITALKMLMNVSEEGKLSIDHSSDVENVQYSQTSESHDTCASLHGSDKEIETIMPTAPKKIEQVAYPVIVLRATVNVKI